MEIPITLPAAPQAVVARDCPACGAREGPERLRHGRWRLIECSTCRLVYMPEIPSAEAIESEFEWSQSFQRERIERWVSSPLARFWTALVLFLKGSRERRALRRIRRSAPAGGRLLDVGAGSGRLAALAQRRGFEVTCVELSPAMAAKAVQRLGAKRVRVGRLADFAFEPASFDVAVAISFIEHEPEPALLLRRLHEILRDGGALLLKAPNYDSRLRTLRGKNWAGYRWPEHVQYFTPRTLSALVCAAGFEIGRIDAPALGDNLWLVARRCARLAPAT